MRLTLIIILIYIIIIHNEPYITHHKTIDNMSRKTGNKTGKNTQIVHSYGNYKCRPSYSTFNMQNTPCKRDTRARLSQWQLKLQCLPLFDEITDIIFCHFDHPCTSVAFSCVCKATRNVFQKLHEKLLVDYITACWDSDGAFFTNTVMRVSRLKDLRYIQVLELGDGTNCCRLNWD